MAKFSISIQKGHKRKDNLWPITIKVAHMSDRGFIDTGIYVSAKQMNKKFQLTDSYVVEDLNSRINKYKKHIEQELRDRIFQYTAKELALYFEDLTKNEGKEREVIDFIEFSNAVIAATKNKGTAGIYQTSINRLKDFTKRDSINIDFIDSKLLEKFEAWLLDNDVEIGGINVYMRQIRALFKKAQLEYNDEDRGIMRIKHYPFKKYKIPDPPPTRKRALDVKKIRQIRDLKLIQKRDILAQDVFMLSLYLVGMNTVDLYFMDKTEYSKGRLSYNRTKTETRRDDMAFISIKVEPEAIPLIEKYRDWTGERLFIFHKMYCNHKNFNKAVNIGLKSIGKNDLIKIDDLEFYAARHSWATIARNDCQVSKEDVHEALNHSDPDMKVTDIYINKDWSAIDNANRKVLDLLNKSKEINNKQ